MCVYVYNFAGLYFKGRIRKKVTFHSFDSYQKDLLNNTMVKILKS